MSSGLRERRKLSFGIGLPGFAAGFQGQVA
jgi:hypothetical protein